MVHVRHTILGAVPRGYPEYSGEFMDDWTAVIELMWI